METIFDHSPTPDELRDLGVVSGNKEEYVQRLRDLTRRLWGDEWPPEVEALLAVLALARLRGDRGLYERTLRKIPQEYRQRMRGLGFEPVPPSAVVDGGG